MQRRGSAEAAESGEITGSGRRFFFPLSETNFKHLFWRRLLLSFSFKVLTKKGDGINSSWLSSGNPGLLWDWEKKGKAKMKTQPAQLNDGAGIIGEPAAR